MANITVIGAGAFGTAISLSLLNGGHRVTLWCRNLDKAEKLINTRENDRLLGVKIPPEIEITADRSSFENCDVAVMAVPSYAIADTIKLLKNKKNGIIVSLAKGFDPATLSRLSTVMEKSVTVPVAVLSGPSHAEEIARKIPTSLVAAGKDINISKTIAQIFSTPYLRVYTSNDLCGVELGGALKNVIAVCSGICDGLNLGDNSRAALITRGLCEMARLGEKMGAQKATFSGLSGMGDLIVTCSSKYSRNRRFGTLIASGESVENALIQVGTVEGYHAAKYTYMLAKKHGVDMPICNECYQILYNGKLPKDAVGELMLRPLKDESEPLLMETKL